MSSWAYPRTTKQSNSNWFTCVCTSLLNLHVGQGYAQTSLTSNCKSKFGNHPHPLDHMPTTALSTTCFAVLSHWTPWSSKGRTFHRPEKACEHFRGREAVSILSASLDLASPGFGHERSSHGAQVPRAASKYPYSVGSYVAYYRTCIDYTKLYHYT